MTKGRLIGLTIGVVLIAAAFSIVLWQGMNASTSNVAFAQGSATATPNAAPTTAPSPQQAPQQQPAPQPPQTIGDNFWTLLAAKLGVSADDLKKKAVETRQEMIDQAVKDGRITQAQGDALKQRITSNNIIAPIPLPRAAQGNQNQNGQPPFGPFGQRKGNGRVMPGMGLGKGMMGGGIELLEAVAKVLKLEPQALLQQMATGKTLAEIAKAQGVDEAAVKKAIIDTATARIDQLLAYGLISQVRAEQFKARLTPDSIDLSRPLWFQFRMNKNAPGTSQEIPGFNGETFGAEFDDGEAFGESFGFAPFDMQFDQMFGTDGALRMPPDNLQTQ